MCWDLDGIQTHPSFVVLFVCKNKEDPFKIENTRVVTTFLPLSVYEDFPDAKGQLTPQSKIPSGQISNPSENLWVSMLPARMKKIQSKVKALEWQQHFSHYKSMWIFQDAQGQLTHKSLVRSC